MDLFKAGDVRNATSRARHGAMPGRGPARVAVRRAAILLALGFFAGPAFADAAKPASTGSDDTETVVVEGERILGPGLSSEGAADYSMTSSDIAALPAGDNTSVTDILAQMPGVAIDQNQQIHIRNTEGPQFQYQINGVLIPLDINTNPPFLSTINPLFISRLDLLTGVLPARYSYATGGVVDIRTKDGCESPGGSASVFTGQREMLQPSVEYAGCSGSLSYFGSLVYSQNNMAFSSATPGPNAIHDHTQQGQGFGMLSYPVDANTRLSLIASVSDSDNQLPNVPDLTPEFTLAGAPIIPSSKINSSLNFRDYLGVLSLSGAPSGRLSYQLSYAVHSISELFEPDNAGELLYQGVASTASHRDFDNTVQGDLTYILGRHTFGTGFYFGAYDVTADDSSLVFPADASGNQSRDIPVRIVNNDEALNIVTGVYVNDLWNINSWLRANFGLRWDHLTGFTRGSAIDPTVNLTWTLAPDTDIHGGFARNMQVPSFQGISPGAPAAFSGTTAEGPPGVVTPVVENDSEWDVGIVHTLLPGLTVSEDNFYEITEHYLDTGQFGDVPIFAPFNYNSGYIWGIEAAVAYKMDSLSTYANVTLGRNWQKGVDTGQFNFDPDELAYIDSHHILLDHQPLVGITAGGAYDWKPWSFSLDATYSSGLQAGFADLVHLPNVFQVNVGIGRTFDIPGVGAVNNRLTLLNIFDRTNLIRPSEGIGIFQSAYGPRFTIFDALTVPL